MCPFTHLQWILYPGQGCTGSGAYPRSTANKVQTYQSITSTFKAKWQTKGIYFIQASHLVPSFAQFINCHSLANSLQHSCEQAIVLHIFSNCCSCCVTGPHSEDSVTCHLPHTWDKTYLRLTSVALIDRGVLVMPSFPPREHGQWTIPQR